MNLPLFYLPGFAEDAADYTQWCKPVCVEAFPRAFGLCLSEAGLGLLSPAYAKPYYVSHRPNAHHRELIKACGRGTTLLDAFAGYGGDGLMLAQQGWRVTLMEREPWVWLLLRDACQGVAAADVVLGDGIGLLASAGPQWDVVYLDPMFPERSKRALPSRGLQHLRDFTTPFEYELDTCIEVACARARQRVVLKRRAKDPVVSRPNFQVRGKTIRFDVYVGLASESTA